MAMEVLSFPFSSPFSFSSCISKGEPWGRVGERWPWVRVGETSRWGLSGIDEGSREEGEEAPSAAVTTHGTGRMAKSRYPERNEVEVKERVDMVDDDRRRWRPASVSFSSGAFPGRGWTADGESARRVDAWSHAKASPITTGGGGRRIHTHCEGVQATSASDGRREVEAKEEVDSAIESILSSPSTKETTLLEESNRRRCPFARLRCFPCTPKPCWGPRVRMGSVGDISSCAGEVFFSQTPASDGLEVHRCCSVRHACR